MELDQEQEDSQEEENDSQREESPKGDETQKESDIQAEMTEEESSEEGSSMEKKKREDSHSTLTSEEESDVGQPSTSKLRPIPSLVDNTTESAGFDLEDPLGVKAMKVVLAETTGLKGPKGPRKWKATTPLKKLTSAIKLAKENAHLKLKGSTPSGYYKRPKAPKGKAGKKEKMEAWHTISSGNSVLP